jgi:hypothetical protein
MAEKTKFVCPLYIVLELLEYLSNFIRKRLNVSEKLCGMVHAWVGQKLLKRKK